MCLILLAHHVHPDYPLVLAANRDEFHERPTARAGFWDDAPDVLGGRDLRSGGTWLALHRSGRWAAVTNFREGNSVEPGELSRGRLVSDYVTGDAGAEEYLEDLDSRKDRFAGYNLLIGDGERVYWSSNRHAGGDAFERLEPGIHGVSNHLLNTPWPKVVRGKEAIRNLLEEDAPPPPERLLDILMDETYTADHLLPSTGVPRDLERALSASFIRTPDYGTRSSTALLIPRDRPISFAERRFDPKANVSGEDRFEIPRAPPADRS